MKTLIEIVEKHKTTNIKDIVGERIKEFESVGKDFEKIKQEVCFCLLTANFSAAGGIKIQNELRDKFFTLSKEDLASELSRLGHRFPNKRAEFISLLKDKLELLEETLKKDNELEIRDWLVENIKGLGMKESSHLMRNIGFKNLAIIDFHIIDLLVREKIIDESKYKFLTKNKYIEIENILNQIAKESNITLAELDLYLWFEETGKILK